MCNLVNHTVSWKSITYWTEYVGINTIIMINTIITGERVQYVMPNTVIILSVVKNSVENIYTCQFKTGNEFTNKRKVLEQQAPF